MVLYKKSALIGFRKMKQLLNTKKILPTVFFKSIVITENVKVKKLYATLMAPELR